MNIFFISFSYWVADSLTITSIRSKGPSWDDVGLDVVVGLAAAVVADEDKHDWDISEDSPASSSMLATFLQAYFWLKINCEKKLKKKRAHWINKFTVIWVDDKRFLAGLLDIM